MAVTGSATLIGFATAAAWLIERRGIRIDYLDNWRVRDLRAFTAFEKDGTSSRAPAAFMGPGPRGPLPARRRDRHRPGFRPPRPWPALPAAWA